MACDLLVAPARRAHRPGLLLARLALISLFGAEFGTPAAFAAPGDLDTTFDTDGKVTTNFGFYSSRGYGLAIQADGKLLVAGGLGGFFWNGSIRSFALVRFTTSGALDPSFGDGGIAATPIGRDELAFSVAVQSDGRIVAAGWSSNGTNRDFALVRYTDSGALDTSFGTGGIVTTPIGSSDESGNGVAVQSDGKIVVAGVSSTGSNQVIALVRYTDTGALDPSFGTGGKVTTALGGTFDLANSVVLQSDGKIVVAGDSVQVGSFDVALVRYTAGGALDVDFGKGGMVTTSIGSSDDTGQKVVVQEDGKIVIVGATWEGTNTHIALLRYTTDGALDPNFGTGGIVTTDFGDSSVGSDLAVQADAKIVVAGWTWNGSNRDFALARYTTSGALDAGFGIAGKATTDLGGRDDYGFGVAVQSDGKIVVAGFSQPGGRDAIALVRYDGGSAARPLTLRIGQPLSSRFTLTLTGSPNATNQIEFTDRLLSPSGTVWNSLSTVKLDGQGIGVITDLPAAPVRFYRAVAP